MFLCAYNGINGKPRLDHSVYNCLQYTSMGRHHLKCMFHYMTEYIIARLSNSDGCSKYDRNAAVFCLCGPYTPNSNECWFHFGLCKNQCRILGWYRFTLLTLDTFYRPCHLLEEFGTQLPDVEVYSTFYSLNSVLMLCYFSWFDGVVRKQKVIKWTLLRLHITLNRNNHPRTLCLCTHLSLQRHRNRGRPLSLL